MKKCRGNAKPRRQPQTRKLLPVQFDFKENQTQLYSIALLLKQMEKRWHGFPLYHPLLFIMLFTKAKCRFSFIRDDMFNGIGDVRQFVLEKRREGFVVC